MEREKCFIRTLGRLMNSISERILQHNGKFYIYGAGNRGKATCLYLEGYIDVEAFVVTEKKMILYELGKRIIQLLQ